MPVSRLARAIKGAGKKGGCAFMPYVCAGDPDEATCERVVDALVSAGADAIELGLPFSDPIADGPTIQRASQRSLSAGMNTGRYFRFAGRVSRKHGIPLIAMTYYNLVLQYGVGRFAGECARNGVCGVIVPDLPVEESEPLRRACRKNGVDLVFLVAPTTGGRRLSTILSKASGFVYLVSVLGVTGARRKLASGVRALAGRVKSKTRLPICLGFGISRPQHAMRAREFGVDGVIVGSAMIDVVERNLRDRGKMVSELSAFARRMKEACSN